MGVEVVKGILGFVVDLCLSFGGSKLKLMVHLVLGQTKICVRVNHVLVFTKVRNWVVDWITKCSLLLFVLRAST